VTSVSNITSVAGVDGCRGGWVCVSFVSDPADSEVRIFASFEKLAGNLADNTVIAVDMPIGLPSHTGKDGRGPEKLVRPLLGLRQSSVFSIPARAAIYCDDYREACRVAYTSSDPPRRVSRQAFHLFPKIRELDAFLRANIGERHRIIEVHPEFAFRALNDEEPMQLPKKIKGRVNPAGIAERKELLRRQGFDERILAAPTPRGAGEDDVLDACVLALMAKRYAAGVARPWPDPPGEDDFGIPIAIWA
jgi:predicted RNase H-like nuclease